MKILIIGTPRSGTTILMVGLGKVLDCPTIGEPFNNLRIIKRKYPLKLIDNIVVKTLIDHIPEEYTSDEYFYTNFSKEFDKIILLGRRDLQQQYESYIHAINTSNKHLGWHERYVFTDHDFNEEKYNHLISIKKDLMYCSKKLNTPITWYEDLYSGNREKVKEIVEMWNIDLDLQKLLYFLDPKKRYRQFNLQETII